MALAGPIGLAHLRVVGSLDLGAEEGEDEVFPRSCLQLQQHLSPRAVEENGTLIFIELEVLTQDANEEIHQKEEDSHPDAIEKGVCPDLNWCCN